MIVREVVTDCRVQREALARMAQINRLLLKAKASAAKVLRAEYAELDQSWVTVRLTERADVITEAEGIELDRLAAIEAANASIRAELAANDVKALRALLEGDQERIAAHVKVQAELRAKLVP